MMDRRYYDVSKAFGLELVIDGWTRAVANDMYASMQSKLENAFSKVVESTLTAFCD